MPFVGNVLDRLCFVYFKVCFFCTFTYMFHNLFFILILTSTDELFYRFFKKKQEKQLPHFFVIFFVLPLNNLSFFINNFHCFFEVIGCFIFFRHF